MNGALPEARKRGVTRLCHFTKSSSLAHILATGEIRDTAALIASPDGYRPTDERRRDKRFGYVCCSLEYPNSWYLNKAREREPNFPDWVVLTLDLHLLAADDVEYCPHNAARSTAEFRAGPEGFGALFAEPVLGRSRGPAHPDWWPTDDQAEVLIPG
ncbi:MAG: DarT ssDNA thymidine ADP-ribosyltransferase family protein, partial [Acidimicrobiales bacterium]